MPTRFERMDSLTPFYGLAAFLQYYSDIANSGNVVAFVEWDTFRGSWAGEEWIKRNA